MAFLDTRPPQGLEPKPETELREKVDWKELEKAAAKKVGRDHRSAVNRQLSQFEIPDPEMRADIQAWMLRLHKPDMSEFGLQTAVDQTMEMVDFVRNHVVIPAAATRALEIGNIDDFCIAGNQFNSGWEAAIRLLFLPDPENPGAGKTAPNIFENTRYFLNDFARISSQTIGDGIQMNTLGTLKEGHWPRLFPGNPVAPNGIYFESLDCTEELQAEGNPGRNADGTQGLSHCVGGYTHQCKSSFRTSRAFAGAFRRRTQLLASLKRAFSAWPPSSFTRSKTSASLSHEVSSTQ
ncbi:hypothetical protein AYJ57_21685 (plasmid) [Salipiger sp. CCB-MM3]|uniref:hypothetical protein n=1 Tax=Salipiger sp. CCB-MM3 TaxID=1792508 RepID=UPI00080AA8FF|nr:hypothetical protein [Salipiger sp. CCB-MM3]ANT63086.1 hypothetical protein AYJ57_21685 [Salipiger sp. CCB-MM3]